MRATTMIGILLIALGIAGLTFTAFSYTTTDEVAKIGPLTATAEHQHDVNIPPYAGVVAIVLGGVVLLVGRSRA